MAILMILVYIFACWSGWFMYKWAYERGKKSRDEEVYKLQMTIKHLRGKKYD